MGGSFITLLAFCFTLLLVNLMLNGSGTEADCSEYPGIGYNTSDDCSSNCTDYCKSKISCENVTNPCDPNYPYDPHHLCDTCDPCRNCPDLDSFYLCDEIIRFPHENNNCDPCKRGSGNETEFCFSRVGTPPPPPPVEPAPSFNYCFNPFSGGICKLYNNAACFCTFNCD